MLFHYRLVEGEDQFSFKRIPYAVPVLDTDRWTHSTPMTTLNDCHEGMLPSTSAFIFVVYVFIYLLCISVYVSRNVFLSSQTVMGKFSLNLFTFYLYQLPYCLHYRYIRSTWSQ